MFLAIELGWIELLVSKQQKQRRMSLHSGAWLVEHLLNAVALEADLTALPPSCLLEKGHPLPVGYRMQQVVLSPLQSFEVLMVLA